MPPAWAVKRRYKPRKPPAPRPGYRSSLNNLLSFFPLVRAPDSGLVAAHLSMCAHPFLAMRHRPGRTVTSEGDIVSVRCGQPNYDEVFGRSATGAIRP
jgi:hypothetical protein